MEFKVGYRFYTAMIDVILIYIKKQEKSWISHSIDDFFDSKIIYNSARNQFSSQKLQRKYPDIVNLPREFVLAGG